uniref:Uncharacterized protein n=1 Tax=Solanum lycopersicum TaxID=4081 RepID=A0A3Q7I2K6_SOLLC
MEKQEVPANPNRGDLGYGAQCQPLLKIKKIPPSLVPMGYLHSIQCRLGKARSTRNTANRAKLKMLHHIGNFEGRSVKLRNKL